MGEKSDLRELLAQKESEIKLLKARLLVAQHDAETYESALEGALVEFARVNAELEAVYASQRWKLTEPLSKFKQSIKRSGPAPPPDAPVPDLYSIPKDGQTILLIDRSIPRPNTDAGSTAMLGYIELLLDMGWRVLVMGEDFLPPPNGVYGPEQLNAIPLHGPQYKNGWRDFISANSARLNAAIISRPNVAMRFLPFIKQHTNARILYFGQDLHFLRESRAPKTEQGNVEIAKAMEFSAMSDAGAVVMYSAEERDIIKKEFGIKAVCAPLFFYRDIPDRTTPFSGTKDIFFVGSFAHSPNTDAVKWFASEVFPIVRRGAAGVRFIVAGVGPTDEVSALACDDIIIAGGVSAEQLLGFYASSRVCVIPLRYGAGVKGKTLEAMYNGLPLVSTSAGIEGMEGIEQVISPCDTPESFAERALSLYNNSGEWERTRAAYPPYLKKYFSYAAARKLMEKLLNE